PSCMVAAPLRARASPHGPRPVAPEPNCETAENMDGSVAFSALAPKAESRLVGRAVAAVLVPIMCSGTVSSMATAVSPSGLPTVSSHRPSQPLLSPPEPPGWPDIQFAIEVKCERSGFGYPTPITQATWPAPYRAASFGSDGCRPNPPSIGSTLSAATATDPRAE